MRGLAQGGGGSSESPKISVRPLCFGNEVKSIDSIINLCKMKFNIFNSPLGIAFTSQVVLGVIMHR